MSNRCGFRWEILLQKLYKLLLDKRQLINNATINASVHLLSKHFFNNNHTYINNIDLIKQSNFAIF